MTGFDEPAKREIIRWLRIIGTLKEMPCDFLSEDKDATVFHFLGRNGIEFLLNAFFECMNNRWPCQSFRCKYKRETSDGLFTLEFEGDDLTCAFDSAKHGKPHAPDICINFTCKMKDPNIPLERLKPHEEEDASGCSCAVS